MVHLNDKRQAGQAMVEFAILMFIIFALCLGMLYSTRLLTFQYWAQQEARFIAFEQDWVAKEWGSDPQAQLDNEDYFHRPPVVGRLPAIKEANDDGGMFQLLAWFKPAEEPAQDSLVEPEPVMLASAEKQSHLKSSVWTHRTVDLFRNGTGVEDLLIPSAYASQRNVSRTSVTSVRGIMPSPKYQSVPQGYVSDNQLERYTIRMLRLGEIGLQVCQVQQQVLRKHGITPRTTDLAACGEMFNRDFGEHIVRTTDLRGLFQEYGERIDDGAGAGEALNNTIAVVTATGFYSLFDQKVRDAMSNAPSQLNSSWLDAALQIASNGEISRVLTEMRYLGSNAAVAGILAGITLTLTQSASNENVATEKTFEDNLRDGIFIDAEDPLGVGLGGYILGADYLPIPPVIDGMFSLLFDGVMRNVLNQEGGLVGPLIDDSNKTVEVSFDAHTGIQLPVARKFDNTNMTLQAKFYLVTQPWHIHRREEGPGSYRDKGGQDDEMDMETEEAVLRRRTFGLWLFPAQPLSLISPVMGVLASQLDLTGVLSAFQGFDSVIGTIKDLIFNKNPFKIIGDAMEDLPLLGNLDITLPEWPSVRPDAYPRSVELKDDKLACHESNPNSCSARTFADYITEQRNNNPKPDPEFN